MNTIGKELKQGADASVASADLTKQTPQEEVNASSEEVKVAEGCTLIGPQTKKISGAQRKKLVRERKMKEGTWTAEKPIRKTPPSQDRGTAGGSGGVKRPHSDSSTPPQAKQQPKKPRGTQAQTGTYKEAVVGIKMAIVHKLHPDVNLDQAQIDIIQDELLKAIDANPLVEASPQFLYSKFAQGAFWITCANELTKNWLIRTVSGLGELWEGAELTVVDSKDLPKRFRVLVRIPDTSDVNTVLTRLRKQNSELHTSDWSVMSRKVMEKGQTLAFSIDLESSKALAKSHFKAFWGLGRIIFRPLKETKKAPEAESTSSKSAPQ
jgi:hypothetical protein